MSNWKTTEQKTVYENAFLKVYENKVIDPNGNIRKMNLIESSYDSAVIIAENIDGELYLVGQPRYATGSYSWEFVSGGIKDGETPEEAAKRELVEELGIRAANWKKLISFHPMNSLVKRRVFVYRACELKVEQAQRDCYERIDVRTASPETIKKEVLSGKIKDSYTICALFAYFSPPVS